VEAAAKSVTSSVSLADLPEAVRRIVSELRQKGFEPNLIVLPEDHRFGVALFQRPLWEIESITTPKGFFGPWEGILVGRWPDESAVSILVADTHKLFAKVNTLGSALQVELIDPPADAAVALHEKAKAAVSAAEVPEPSCVQATACVHMTPPIALCDKEAATSLVSDGWDACYGMVREENIFHRPSCAALSFREDAVYAHVKLLPGENIDRAPCEKCNP